MTSIVIYPDPEALAHGAAEHFSACAAEAIARQGRFSVALSGGSTPRALYEKLGTLPYRDQITWAKVHIFFGDERCVPPDDSQSNYRMAEQTLLAKVPLPAANIHRMHGEDNPSGAAAAYERELREFFGSDAEEDESSVARFDLILLGLGEDGHTASLFPETPPVGETRHWVLANFVAKLKMWRLTLTPVVINNAREVLFLVEGESKAARLEEVLHGGYRPTELPAQIVHPEEGETRWFVDRAAASQLKEVP